MHCLFFEKSTVKGLASFELMTHSILYCSVAFIYQIIHTEAQTKHRETNSIHTPLCVRVMSCLWMRDCGRTAEVLTASRVALLSVCHSHTCTGTATNNSHTRIDWILCVFSLCTAGTFKHTANITSQTNSRVDRKSTRFVSGHYLHRCVFNVQMSYNHLNWRMQK